MTDEHPDARARDRDEAPSPRRTVVGGRPPEGGIGITSLPEGIQLLLTAGSRDDEFRVCFLEDPLLAARRAGVSLTDTERSILRAVPGAQLTAMIDGLAVSNPQRRRFLQSAATAALTVFAGTALAACGESTDEPEPEPQAPLTGVAAALAEAKRIGRPSMVVIRSERGEGPHNGLRQDGWTGRPGFADYAELRTTKRRRAARRTGP